MNVIRLTAEENACGYDRVKWAEGFIVLLSAALVGHDAL
jgi:hypothetical protein